MNSMLSTRKCQISLTRLGILAFVVLLALLPLVTSNLFIDKERYVLGESVTITLDTEGIGEPQLWIRTGDGNYRYNGKLDEQFQYTPAAEGTYVITLLNRLDPNFSLEQEFTVTLSSEEVSEESIEQDFVSNESEKAEEETNYSITIFTDKSSYSVGETVQIMGSALPSEDLLLYIQTSAEHFRYMGEIVFPLTFPLTIPGEHKVELREKDGDLINEIVFTVAEKAEFEPTEPILENISENKTVSESIMENETNNTATNNISFTISQNSTHNETNQTTEIFITEEIVSEETIVVESSDLLAIMDNKGKRDTFTIRKRNPSFFAEMKEFIGLGEADMPKVGETTDVEITVGSNIIDSMHLDGLQIKEKLRIGVDEVPPENVNELPGQVRHSYALDFSDANFTNGTVTRIAEGRELWKCADWNFTEQRCFGSWEKQIDLIPGEEYSFAVYPGDPGYVEILITGALHLDENRSLIEDIYPEVSARDNIWQTIPEDHYVRVAFEKNLTSDKDITIYARSQNISSNASLSVEVYEEDGTTVLATFTNITLDMKYQIFLTALNGSQDTFDLKILGDTIAFDYITDPTEALDRFNATTGNSGHIRDGNCGGNGAATTLMNSGSQIGIGNWNTGQGREFRMYIDFDTSSIPDTAVINSADLYVYLNTENGEAGDTVEVYTCDYGSSLENADFQNTNLGYTHGTIFTGSSATGQFHSQSLGVGDGNISLTGNTRFCLTINNGCVDTQDRWVTDSRTAPVQPYLMVNYTSNAIPTHTTPILTSTSGDNLTSDNLTCSNQSTADGDGDTVNNIFTFYNNGTTNKLLHLPFDVNSSGIFGENPNSESGTEIVEVGQRGRSINVSTGDTLNYAESGNINNQYGTVEFWVAANSDIWENAANNYLFRYRIDGDNQIYILANSNDYLRWRYEGQNDGQNYNWEGSDSWGIGDWHHVAMTWNSSAPYFKAYADGVLLSTRTSILPIAAGTSTIRIGESSDILMDEFIIYDRVLSDDEIALHANEQYNIILSNDTIVGDEWMCEVTPSDGYVYGSTLSSNNLTIVTPPVNPPNIGTVECYEQGGTWGACTGLAFGETLERVRANCTSDGGPGVQNVSFRLTNVEDNTVFFDVMNTSGSGDLWEYDVPDVTIEDSGSWNLRITCEENPTTIKDVNWSLPFGTATLSLIDPSTDSSVIQYDFFNFTSRITCTGGECGWFNVTLDPIVGGNNDAFSPDAGQYIDVDGTITTNNAYTALQTYDADCNSGGSECWGLQYNGDNPAAGYMELDFNVSVMNITDPTILLDNLTVFVSYCYDGSTAAASMECSNNDQYEGDLTLPQDIYVYDWVGTDWEDVGNLDAYGPAEDCSGSACQNIIQTDEDFYSSGSDLSRYVNSSGFMRVRIEHDPGTVSSQADMVVDYVRINLSTTQGPKGVVPMNSGTPFYTTTQNPANSSTFSCLADMIDGDSCDTTWAVNATGNINSTWVFFVDYGSINYTANVSGGQTANVNVTIMASIPPSINTIQCYEQGVGWETCSNLAWGETLERVRANCTEGSSGPIQNVSFNLSNVPDSQTFFSVVNTSGSGDWWEYDVPDVTIQDSGLWRLRVSCTENPTTTEDEEWNVSWGTLSAILVQPNTSVNVTQNKTFNFTSRITCTGGECGWVNATLDPPQPWDNSNYTYRTHVNLSETQSTTRTDEHFLAKFTIAENILPDSAENSTVMYCNGTQVPWDAYATATSGGWVTELTGLLEVDVAADENIGCYVYMDPSYTGTEMAMTTTGWGYVADGDTAGTVDWKDLTPAGVDCSGQDDDGEWEAIYPCTGGDSETYGVNEWCYFLGQTTGSQNFWRDSDDCSVLYADGTNVAEGCYNAPDTGSYSTTLNEYHNMTVYWAENTGGNFVRMALGSSDTGQELDTECYPYLGDEWLLSASYGATEQNTKGIIPMNSGTPFYTTTQNPANSSTFSCLASMGAGDSCDTSWIVNATGTIGSTWEFFVTYEAMNYSGNVSAGITPSVNITIGTNAAPSVQNVTLIPEYPVYTDNLNCTFTVTDADISPTLSATVRWYKNNVLNYSQGYSVTKDVPYTAVLSSGNTSIDDVWHCGVTPYDTFDYGSELNSTNRTILASLPPDIHSIECQEGGAWAACSNILWSDTLQAVRTDCTDSDGNVTNVTFTLQNMEDSTIFFSNVSLDNSSGYWTFNNTDIVINDSGTWNLTVICTDNTDSSRINDSVWTVPWGTLTAILLDPDEDVNVTLNAFFNFSSRITCTGGECGWLNASLDPIPGWWNESWKYRKTLTISENAGYSLTDYQFNITVDTQTLISEGKLQNGCEDLRFVADDNATELSFWVASGCDTTSTLIWVEGDVSANSNTTIYMYYDNSAASSASDPFTAMFLYEDMEQTPSGSIIGDAAYVDNNTGVQITTATGNRLGYLYYVENPGPGFYGRYETWAGGGSGADSTWIGVHSDSVTSTREDITDGGYHFTVDEWQDRIAFTKSTTDNGAPIASWTSATLDDSSWHELEVFFFNDGSSANALIYYDGTLRVNGTDSSSIRDTDGQYFLFGGRTGGSTNEHRIRGIEVRKYVNPEPTFTISQEILGSKGLIPMNSGDPFYTTTQNPANSSTFSCLADMKDGDSCDTEWVVNATGITGIPYEFFVIYESLNYSVVTSGITPKINITIIANLAPSVTDIIITPPFPLPTEDLYCNFTVFDPNAFDTLTANVSWYRNDSYYSSVIVNPTNGVEMSVTLGAGNTSLDDTWHCGVRPSDGQNTGLEVNSTNVTIVLVKPPDLTEIQCEINGSAWFDCTTVSWDETITRIRANCTSDYNTVTNVTFNLTNIPDNNLYFETTTSSSSGDWWILNNADVLINNSGGYLLEAICFDNESASDELSVNWTVPWGHFEITLVDPDADISVEQNDYFDFTAEIACVGGECGDAIAILDPEEVGDTEVRKRSLQPIAAESNGNLMKPPLPMSKKVGNAAYSRGLATITSLRPRYTPGEQARIAIALLDAKGELKNAEDVMLTVTSPDNSFETFSEVDLLEKAQGLYTFDYQATNIIGSYLLNLEVYGVGAVESLFEVSEEETPIIHRQAPLAIDPWHGTFEVLLRVETEEEGLITVTERLPKEITILEAPDANVWCSDKECLITWNDVMPGQILWYEAQGLKVSPDRYLLRASMADKNGLHEEERPWMIAVDPDNYYSADSDAVDTTSDGAFTEVDEGDYTDTVTADCSGGTCTNSNSWLSGLEDFGDTEPYDCELNATLTFNVSDLNADYIQNLTLTWAGCWHGDDVFTNNNCDNGDNPEFDDGTGGGSFNMWIESTSGWELLTCVDTVGSECGSGEEINLGTDTVGPSWGNADSYNTFNFEKTGLNSSYVSNDRISLRWRVFGTNVCGDSDTDDDIVLAIDYANLTVEWNYLIKDGMVSTIIGDEPFYTTEPNPTNRTHESCLAAMIAGDTCEIIWQVNATGGINTTHEFYVIANTTQYTSYLPGNDSEHIFITIADTSNVPPVVTLESPANNAATNNSNVDFNCSATDNNGLTNITLYADFNGSWVANGTNALSGTADSTLFSRTLVDGIYSWNCLAYDDDDNYDWGTQNYTLTVDTVKPNIVLSAPTPDASLFTSTVEFNFTVTDNLDTSLTCNLSINGSVVDANFAAPDSILVSRTITNLNQSTYTWFVTCWDDAGNVNTSVTRNFSIIDIPPTVTLVTPNATYFNSTTISLEFNATDNNNVTTAYLFIDGVLNDTMIDPQDGIIESFTINGLTEGIHNWTINVTDASGLSDIATVQWFYVDLGYPNITLHAPIDNYNTSNWTVLFNFTVFDAIDPTLLCNITVNGTVLAFNVSAMNGSPTTHVVGKVPDGVQLWNVTCWDSAGNTNISETRTLNMSAPPTVILNFPDDGHSQALSTITFNYTPDDNTGLASCSLILDGVVNDTDSGVQNGTINNFTVTGLTVGQHSWTVNCTDTFGLSYAPPLRYFTYDLAEPNIQLHNPLPDEDFYTKSILFNWTVTDDADLNLECNLTIDGTVEASSVLSPNGTWVNVTLNVTVDGLHWWNVTCWDDAGNINTSERRNFSTYNPPEITLISPNDTIILNYRDNVTFTYQPIDSDGIANASLIIDGLVNYTDYSVTSGIYNNFTINFSTDGVFTWSVNATDNIGLEGNSTTRTITIDTTPPVIGYITPYEGETATVNNVSFTFNVTDNLDSSLLCNITVNDVVEWSNITISSGSNTTRYKLLTDGNYNWSVICIDHANNINTISTINFSVVAPPNVTLNFPIDNYRTTSQDILFNYTPIDFYGFQNCTLYINGIENRTNTSVEKNIPNYFNLTNIAEGDYNWTVECIDEDPDFNSYTPPVENFTIDISGPIITINNPQNDDILNNNSVVFNWTPVDYDVLITCDFYLDGSLNESGITGQSGDDFTELRINLTDGEHNWSVNCSDDLNNSAFSGWINFTINQPDLRVFDGNLSFNNTNPNIDENITISADISNYGGIPATNVLVSFYDGKPGAGGTLIGNDTIATIGINNTETAAVTWLIPEGFHVVWVLVDPLEAIGELNETNNNATINISTLVSRINSPDNETYFNVSSFTLNFTIADYLAGTVDYTVFIDGVSNATGTSNDNESDTELLTLTDGRHEIKVQAEDGLGRKKNSTLLVVYIDTTAPTVNWISLNESWYNVTDVTVYFNITDQFSTNISYKLFVDGVYNRTNTTTNGTLTNETITGLSEGTHTLVIQATDELNNTGNSTTLTIYVDLTPPVPLIETQDGTWFSTTTPSIDFNVTDNMDDPINYSFIIDGVLDAGATGEAANATSLSDALSVLGEGSHNVRLEATDEAGNTGNSSNITIWIDVTDPNIVLHNPLQNETLPNRNVTFNFTVTDNLDSTLNCTLFVSDEGSFVIPASNGTPTTYNLTDVSFGLHYWNVTCVDEAGNSNASETWNFTIPAPDLIITSGNITFSNSTPIEGQNITVNATIFNIGNTTASNFTVQFWLGDPNDGGSQINGDFNVSSLISGENASFSVNHTAVIGQNDIYVVVDTPTVTNGSVVEENESNNKAYNTFQVGLYHIFSGITNNLLQVADATVLPVWIWNLSNATGSNVLIADTDSSLDFLSLQALGRDTSQVVQFEDFDELDQQLGSENYSDSINSTWTNSGSPILTRSYTLFNTPISNVPVVNTTNTTSFQTGILWDTSDGVGTEYDGTQDVAFITLINESKTGSKGTYDYEARIPAPLREYTGATPTVSFYVELI